MPVAIAGGRVQPWHIQAVAEYDEARGETTEPNSNIPGMYAASQVNEAIAWWNRRADAEQPHGSYKLHCNEYTTDVKNGPTFYVICECGRGFSWGRECTSMELAAWMADHGWTRPETSGG